MATESCTSWGAVVVSLSRVHEPPALVRYQMPLLPCAATCAAPLPSITRETSRYLPSAIRAGGTQPLESGVMGGSDGAAGVVVGAGSLGSWVGGVVTVSVGTVVGAGEIGRASCRERG